MKIEAVRVRVVRYPLRHVVQSARARTADRSGFRVELHGEGVVGVGEALALESAGTEGLAAMQRALETAAPDCRGGWSDLASFGSHLDAQLIHTPAARTALDLAAHDWIGRRSGRPVAALLGERVQPEIAVNALLHGASPDGLRREAAEARGRGFDAFKLKLLGADDLPRLAAVRAAIGPAARLRADANGCWSADEAAARLADLAPYDLEFVEQPVQATDLDGLARLSATAPVPVAADEALALSEGRSRIAAGGLAPIAVLKPTVLGGLGPAVQLARRARRAGVRCVVTTTWDGPIGCAAALHLAASWGDDGFAHGLDAASQVDAAWPAWLVAKDGVLRLDGYAGLGAGLS